MINTISVNNEKCVVITVCDDVTSGKELKKFKKHTALKLATVQMGTNWSPSICDIKY